MDLMYQMMDQMTVPTPAVQKPAGRDAANQSKNSESGEFDSMVRQKRQEQQGQEPAGKKPEAAKGVADEKGPAETPKDEQSIPDEQYAMAAAMMFQMQPNVTYVEPQTETVEVSEQGPELVTDLAAPMDETLADVPVATAAETVQELSPVAEKQVFADAPEVSVDVKPEDAPEEIRVELPQNEMSGLDSETRNAEVRQNLTEEDDGATEDAAQEAPVFGQVDVVPVKVAEPLAAGPAEGPVHLEAEDAAEQLSAKITPLLTNENGESRVELTLMPESLGKVTVEITHTADGALRIHMSATTERAMNLLERHTGHLQNLLTTDARPTVEIQVRGGGENRQQFLNPDDQQNRQQQQQQQQNRQHQEQRNETQEFLQQLRLGLVGQDGAGEA